MSDYDFKAEMTSRRERAERIIEECLPHEEGFAKTVIKAMNYSIRVGGKRLRPILMQECYRLFSGKNDEFVVEDELRYYMAAIECIHTYSLVHDDLPAMDNDMLRRGEPTTHAKYGEAMAILAGDGLLNYAMELTTRAVDGCADDDVRRLVYAQRLLFDRSGIFGMIGGQTADVEAESSGNAGGQELLSYIHRNKTGALIMAAMMVGAILGGADDEQQRIITSIAQDIGLAFQIRDDILDIEGDEDTLGKPIGSDEKNQKLTYVSVYGIDRAKEDVQKYTREADELLDQLPGNKKFLHALFSELVTRKN
ncbi:MAG: polyprenyl synthetase family protein [Lachnospiraceae bacterium]|nr:polyprenyl synthetase family protein [Lachnospiraceae bacterium]